MKWLQDLYDKLNFQYRYDQIKKWDWSPEMKAKINEIWVKLPLSLQSAIWKLIKNIADKYGDELAKAVLSSVINALKIAE